MFLSDYGYMGPELIWMQIVGRAITKESIFFKLKYTGEMKKLKKLERLIMPNKNFFIHTFFNAPWNIESFLRFDFNKKFQFMP